MDYAHMDILVVEDDPAIGELLLDVLDLGGFSPLLVSSVREARVALADQRPLLIILDWMLPDTSGVEYARQLKRDTITAEIPIIMLTARVDEANIVTGLEAGADDYITKPFAPKELIARCKSAIRRAWPDQAGTRVELGNLAIDTAQHRVFVDQAEIKIGPTEYRLLQFFANHKERVYSRTQLLDFVWGNNVYVDERTVDVHIRRLRKALEPGGCDKMVQTVRGAGYRFSLVE